MKKTKRIAIIDRSLCTNKKCGYVCMNVCPGVKMGDETIKVGEDGFPVISEILCTGCGICPKKCPVKCIKIINLAQETGTLLHQYGVNSFRLYNLPLPQKGVTGLIGKNGIGKSTALKILSGSITPNFGNYKEKGKTLLPSSLGIALKNFLSSPSKSISYKPQNVDKIPDTIKGKVKPLLKKVDERGAFEEAVKKFSLSEVLEKDVSTLSGGELQRVAIAAACLRDADVYYFDEPASYLDIEQRLACALALKELSEKKQVMVVEHDLAVLDYLSDYVYVFFGEENAYGVVSGAKNARSGINEYLQGYLKDENLRFRETEINFSQTSEGERKSRTKLSYPAFSKKFPGFSFSSEEGEIREGEIIGIAGKNAIGKTLFVKMLAGVEKADNGASLPKITLSYKPQYIKAGGNDTVGEFFSSRKLNSAFFEEAKRRLGIAPLLERKIVHLSGGELQRVAITFCLSQEADLYLLDEPSAFLDVEQRLHFSHLLRSLVENSSSSAFVIDHDVVLLDSISSRLMVFEGESSVRGHAPAPKKKKEGMNSFLRSMNVTMRRDKDTGRPRINKPDSVMDRKQKEKGEYYNYKEEE
ncbi:ribosome biogenesis/translation initiation ATPase RLI [Candidatus Micrarchaeota archaeon CG1_02_47_40]|nr:MAG: ribosome biogenesis/translation initiation ATPase RLI [Candidatus Micrarchaeota archaeon CG1_02_47_40]